MTTPAEKASARKAKKRKGLRTTRKFGVLECQLSELRGALGLSMRDVAAGTGLSDACICDAEHGSEICLTTARRIAAFFGTTVDTIWPVKT